MKAKLYSSKAEDIFYALLVARCGCTKSLPMMGMHWCKFMQDQCFNGKSELLKTIHSYSVTE